MFLLSTLGSAGDVHPYVAIALALQRRGHHVVVMTNPYFQDRIAAAGLGFWPVGTRDEYLQMVTHPDLVTPRASIRHVLTNLVLGTFRQQADALREASVALRPQLIVNHHICFGISAAAEVLRIPIVHGVLAPLFWLSHHERIIPPMLPYAPAWMHRAMRRIKRLTGPWTLDRPVNRHRADVGAPPIRRTFLHARGGEDFSPVARTAPANQPPTILGLWSPHFRGSLPDDPTTSHICGFCTWDRPPTSSTQLDQQREITRWMDDAEPPALITLGSSVSHHGKDTYQLAARACAKLNTRALMLTGATSIPASDLPQGIRAVPYAAYSAVMPRAGVIIHHAGIGTLAAAMRAGRPQVILPFANDEFDNTHRARTLNVALEVRPSQRTLKHLCATLDTAINNKPMHTAAQTLGQCMQSESGAERAADAVEKALVEQGR
ncbi:MAG: glycosyltransferase [Phycisphaerales bacterium]|nr:glycosyltransferase [Phycisphaerales bacterium]